MSLTILKKLPHHFASFIELDQIHRVADELLIQHQVYCMQADWDNALLTMDALYHVRMLNMQDEDELLLPVYKNILPELPEGGAIKYFLREHNLIRNKLQVMVRRISRIAQNPNTEDVSIVKLFEEYHRFKDLLDHHDARERAFLYKFLDESSDKFDASDILRTIEKRQKTMLGEFQDRV